MPRLADALHASDVVPPAAYYVPRFSGEVADLPVDREEFVEGFTALRAQADAAQVVVFDAITSFILPAFRDLGGDFSPKAALPPIRREGPFFLETRAPIDEEVGYDGMPRAWGYHANRLPREEWVAFCRNVLKGTPEPGTACLRLTLVIEIIKGQISGPVASHYIPIDEATGDIVSDEWMSGYLPELPANLRPPATLMNPLLSRMLMPALLAWALMDSHLAKFEDVGPPPALVKKRARRKGNKPGRRPMRDYLVLTAPGAEECLRFTGMAGVQGLCAALPTVRDILVPRLKGVRPAYYQGSSLWVPGMS